MQNNTLDILKLRAALEASWKPDTAYLNVMEKGNPALGQCYPSSKVVQLFFPETEIVEGEVWTGKTTEKHFWNLLKISDQEYHIDFTWQQFPHGSSVKSWKVRDRKTIGDSQKTIDRVEGLLKRVKKHLIQ